MKYVSVFPPLTFRWLAMVILSGMFMTISPGFAGTQLLVDFNQSPEAAEMPYPDWNELIYHPQLMEFVVPNEDPDTAGLAESELTAADNYVSTFAGIKGQVPIEFKKGDKVIATFYNRSDQTLRLQARISFTDDDAPDADYDMYNDWQRPWYTMYAENAGHNDFVDPNQFGQLVFNITDEQSVSAPNALPAEGGHSIVNISMDPRYNAWHGAFVLTRIEISDEADLTPPENPKVCRPI